MVGLGVNGSVDFLEFDDCHCPTAGLIRLFSGLNLIHIGLSRTFHSLRSF